jgi:hypothetical protein
LDEDTGNSVAKRAAEVYSLDIDGDGAFDVPFSETVFKQAKVTADYYCFDWFTFNADGNGELCASTYHCYSDSWYYVLPAQLRENFTVRREAGQTGERTVVLSTVDPNTGVITDRLTVYTLTDENRKDRAALPGRFVLLSGETTVYAAKLPADNGEPTEQQRNDVISRFHIIYSEWTTGAV